MTTFPDITPDLKAAMPELRGRLLANQSLAELTWFRVGGPAQVLFTPADEDDLAYFLSHLPRELPVYVVGVGSNLIVRDGGMPGVVIRLSPRGFGETSAEGDIVSAGTAALDKRVAETAAAANIGGLEFYFGIPGTIGGALRMNAGANGAETKDVLIEAVGIGRDGSKHSFSNADMKFVYRNSGVDPSIIFTSARFRGTIAAPEAIRARMNEVQTHRETAQPIREKTGGSTFQNPPGHSAWKLIDAAGCRGLRVGGAQVSEMHCNFLINTGAATGHDIETLGETVRARVKENSGIELHWEIKRIGIPRNRHSGACAAMNPESENARDSGSGLRTSRNDERSELMRITILFGGTNKERLVSVASAQALHQALPEADLWFWDVDDTVHEVRSKRFSIIRGRSRIHSSQAIPRIGTSRRRSTRPRPRIGCWCSACMAAGRRTASCRRCAKCAASPSPGPARLRRISPSTRSRPNALPRLRA